MHGASWDVRPPVAGEVTIKATSTTRAALDLKLCGNQTLNLSNPNTIKKGLVGCMVRIEAVGADCYVVFADAEADLAAIVTNATGTNAATATVPIPAGTFRDYHVQAGVSDWLGYMTASGSGTVIITRSGPYTER